jgi:hypothetical protein
MAWDIERWKDALTTDYIPGVPNEVRNKRISLIDEAMRWAGGSLASPTKIPLEPCSDGSLAYFVKPGKEAFPNKKGKIKNANDMRPVIEVNGTIPKNASFYDVWSDLTKIALADRDAFHAVLILIYRNAFLIDHRIDDENHIRYRPSNGINECIKELDTEVGKVTSLGSVEKLLRFVDLLGWNEDVKYQTQNKNGKERIGRINTSLTCIKIPYETAMFMFNHSKEVVEGRNADFGPLYDIMQALILTRGICPPSMEELPSLLSPYLIDKPEKKTDSGSYGFSAVQRRID